MAFSSFLNHKIMQMDIFGSRQENSSGFFGWARKRAYKRLQRQYISDAIKVAETSRDYHFSVSRSVYGC